MYNQPSQMELWGARYEALGKAQSRYLYLLATITVFYGIVWHEKLRAYDPVNDPPPQVRVPLLGFDLNAFTVVRSAPLIVGLLELAVMGSLTAARHTLDKLDELCSQAIPHPAYDKTPNFLDMVVYGPPNAPPVAFAIAWMSYPILLLLSFVEAIFLGWTYHNRSESYHTISFWDSLVFWLGIVVLLLAFVRLQKFVRGRTKQAFGQLRPAFVRYTQSIHNKIRRALHSINAHFR